MIDNLLFGRLVAKMVAAHEAGIELEEDISRLELITRAMLERLDLFNEYEEDDVVAAVLCHDIGKIAIPAEILRKPGRLTAQETAMVRLHPLQGTMWLQSLGDSRFVAMAVEAAGGHHERLDGKGYPMGIAGDAVTILMRLARVVDVYEALTSRRAYREAYRHEEAVQVMRGMGGFDDRLLDALAGIERSSLLGRRL